MPSLAIESLSDPRLDLYRSLKKSNQNRDHEAFIAEGATVVDRLLQSDFEVLSVLVTDAKAATYANRLPTEVPVYQLSTELASQLVGYRFHMGVLAAGRRPSAREIDTVLSHQGSSLVFVADRVIDQQNMGLLIRIASGFGADALLTTRGSADPFSRRSIRVSTGNGFFLPIVESLSGERAVERLTNLNYTCCATVLSDQAQELSAYPFPERTALIFGNESHGVCESMIAKCDQQLSISMLNGTDSLNVAMAAGIFGYAYRVIHPDPQAIRSGTPR